jgi:hypothetical protein
MERRKDAEADSFVRVTSFRSESTSYVSSLQLLTLAEAAWPTTLSGDAASR